MKGEEGVKTTTTTTTTLDVPNVVPAVDYVVADAVEEIEGGGNDSFAEKENSEVEKEVSDYEDEKEEEDEDDESENGVDDPELETGLSLDDGFFEVEAIRRKRYRKVNYCFLYHLVFVVCVLEYDVDLLLSFFCRDFTGEVGVLCEMVSVQVFIFWWQFLRRKVIYLMMFCL